MKPTESQREIYLNSKLMQCHWWEFRKIRKYKKEYERIRENRPSSTNTNRKEV